MSLSSSLRRLVLGISLEETSFARRGFRPANPQVQRRLEHVGRTFVRGYHAALGMTAPEPLAAELRQVEEEFRGFAFEGAAMGLALLDYLPPLKGNRWQAFLDGPGEPHAYMVHVGLGWAAARLPWVRRSTGRYLRGFDPLLRWLVLDGYGFHEGYFHWQRYAQGQAPPSRLAGYARRAFDQGLGRSLWFVVGADVTRIAETIRSFSPRRHADLYGGVGLACAYAGGVDRPAYEALREAAGDHWVELAQGVAFAAKARQRAGIMAAHAELACEVVCGTTASAAAAITDDSLDGLSADDGPCDPSEPAFEIWRKRIQGRIAKGHIETGGGRWQCSERSG